MLVFAGSIEDLKVLNDWCQAVYHLIYGPLFGEVKFRQLRFEDAVKLWVGRPQ